jgi:hypothetical protein
MTRSLNPFVIVGLGLVLVVAACGGGSAPAASPSGGGNASSGAQPTTSVPTAADPDGGSEGAGGLCDRLTREAAEAALGEAVDGGTAKTSWISGTDICRYTATTGTGNAIQIEFKGDVTRADWEASIDGAGMLDEQLIEGIGEVAYRSSNAVLGPGTRLVAFDHGTTIWVVMSTDREPAAVFAATESVARDILAALST